VNQRRKIEHLDFATAEAVEFAVATIKVLRRLKAAFSRTKSGTTIDLDQGGHT
jgi:hypothetical protein